MADFHFTPVQLGRNALDITGHQYGRLTAISPISKRDGRARWYCACTCGGWAICDTANLRRGNSISCGCALADANAARLTSHGMSKTPTYNIWNKMRARCENVKDGKYPTHGGRGITVCERWQSFDNFLTDMGEKPGRQYSIDRIDNDGNYCPENCRWATPHQQVMNRSVSRYVTHNGVTRSLQDWAEIYGIKYQTLYARINYYGMTFSEAIAKPVGVWKKA